MQQPLKVLHSPLSLLQKFHISTMITCKPSLPEVSEIAPWLPTSSALPLTLPAKTLHLLVAYTIVLQALVLFPKSLKISILNFRKDR